MDLNSSISLRSEIPLLSIGVGFGLNDWRPSATFAYERRFVGFSVAIDVDGDVPSSGFLVTDGVQWRWFFDVFGLKFCCVGGSVICILYILCSCQDVLICRGRIFLGNPKTFCRRWICDFPHI